MLVVCAYVLEKNSLAHDVLLPYLAAGVGRCFHKKIQAAGGIVREMMSEAEKVISRRLSLL
jgi:hypothetical protein